MWFRAPASHSSRPARLNSAGRLAASLGLESLESRRMFAINLLDDVAPGAGTSGAANYVSMGGLTFFTANDNSNGVELWKTDGTSAGTAMVMDIAPGAPSGMPEHLTVFDGKLYFTANDQVHGRELWVTDGTQAGTHMVVDIDNIASSSPDYLTVVGDELLFSAYDPNNGDELWRFDGTTASIVQDLRPGAFGSSPYYLTNVNGTLFFSANNTDAIGRELWKYDATNGVALVRNIADLSFESGNPQNLFAVDGKLYFSAVGPSDNYFGRELYVSDGTSSGTVMVQDINPGVADSSPSYLAEVNGEVWFSAQTAAAGRELWKSDGTSPGTELLYDYTPGSGGSNPISMVHQTAGTFVHFDTYNYIVYFPDSGPVEYRGNNIFPGSQFVGGNGYLYFSRANSGFNYELWQINTTTRAVTLLQEINPSSGSYPQGLAYLNGSLYFTANDGTNGNEPWLATFTPVASITGLPGGNTGPEGTEINVSANITGAGAGGPYTYEWSVTKQGAGSPFATGTSSTFSFTPDDEATYNLSLTVTDSASQQGTVQQAVVITNADPTPTIVGAPVASHAGTSIYLSSSVVDPGVLDTHTYSWVVSDGSTTVASGTDAGISFTPSQVGTYEVTLTVTDNDGGSDSDTVSIDVFEYSTTYGAVVIDDPANPGPSNDDVLLINGSNLSSDSILVRKSSATAVSVYIRGRVVGTFPLSSFGQIVVFGHGGNDTIMIDSPITKPSTIYGGKGSDVISGGSGPDTIYDDEGTDLMVGNAGDDVFYGGLGNDRIVGGAGSDRIVERPGAASITASLLKIGTSQDSYSQIEQLVLTGTPAADNFVFSGVTASVQIDGRGGADTVSYTNNGNFVLTDSLLTHTAGSVVSTVTMTGIASAVLKGGSGANKFNVTDWTRPLSIVGGNGTDTVEAANDVDYVLTPSSLQRTGLPNVVLNTVDKALLTGGASDNSFTVGEWKGTAALAGAGGTDTLLVTDNVAKMTLTDASLARTSRGTITHTGLEAAELTGGNSNNAIHAAAYSGNLQISGLGGHDTLTSGSGTAVVLGGDGNDTLTAGSGPAVLVGGNGNDTLKTGAAPLAGSTAGHTIMIGGAGVDKLTGGGGEDVLIDSSTDFDLLVADLANLLLHWTAGGAYATRASQLELDLDGQLNPDGQSDTMNGGLTSLDLFFANLSGAVSVKDKLTDLNQPTAEVAINNA
jgi:ELWxxDGT repeat protein